MYQSLNENKMKTKKILGATACFVIMILTSCGNGTSSNGNNDSLFDRIPTIYEKKQVEIIEKMKNIAEGKEKEASLAIIAEMKDAFDKAGQEAYPLADKMVGKVLPYSQQDGLPYKIASDIQIEKVILPELGLLNGGGKGTRLKVKFDAVITATVEKYFRLHYLVMSDDEAVGSGRTSGQNKLAAGDTLHVEETIYAPDVPAKYQESCNSLKFVNEESYASEQKIINERQKRWNDEMKDKLGIKEIK